ncbi:hypothetical protein L198_04512 [Cryptococcus wingfieldii CBS 7118]|uniref:Uncharacterized protein n=1 Tax=Cryptococcus wingfieldii CBS 7118 TaxID=1295528 RepID=A0A1E3J4X7_9TREE|nr:hypothetical protein L198_04512 [Cryptococcus wingfieldii CBS 7118]ODN95893.1 hypothetical protein L198_04512 [Cryptococcus wingfieldii CBS 7118]
MSSPPLSPASTRNSFSTAREDNFTSAPQSFGAESHAEEEGGGESTPTRRLQVDTSHQPSSAVDDVASEGGHTPRSPMDFRSGPTPDWDYEAAKPKKAQRMSFVYGTTAGTSSQLPEESAPPASQAGDALPTGDGRRMPEVQRNWSDEVLVGRAPSVSRQSSLASGLVSASEEDDSGSDYAGETRRSVYVPYQSATRSSEGGEGQSQTGEGRRTRRGKMRKYISSCFTGGD